MRHLRWAAVGGLATALAAVAATGALGGVGNGTGKGGGADQLSKIDHIVVIYEENHSFDNLYGGWEGVNGLANADAAHTTQVDQNGVAYSCLKQLDVNLAALPATCTDAHGFTSAFSNTWFTIDDFIPPTATTCPPPLKAFSFPNGVLNGQGLPGGCTRDLVHAFYQNQYQLDGGKLDRYMVGSDSAGTTMGVYNTRALPTYQYLHSTGHPRYAIADNFFQAAFGGSFLNHQWLVAAATPTYPGAAATLHSLVDADGFPRATYPLYAPLPGATYRDGPLTVQCDSPVKPGGACGDYAVNTMQPAFQPSGTFGAKLVPQTNPTIGDRLNGAGVDWAWYSGGWSNADGDVGAPGWTNGTQAAATATGCLDPDVDPTVAHWPECPNNVFQYHHQPLNYYAAFDPATTAGAANRAAHLRDEQEFVQLAQGSGSSCRLKPVSFVKPFGLENSHPGYSSESGSDMHLVSLLKDIEGSACAKNTMVVVTYDEFGGQWDHVPPPGQGGTPGVHDEWGPGTRIPALIVSPYLRGNEVIDHTQYDTTSILATIEQRYGLEPLSTRDAQVNSLADVFRAKQYEAAG
jgi:phospholipase C